MVTIYETKSLMSVHIPEVERHIMSEMNNVQRCLFGRPDRDQLSKDLYDQNRMLADADAKRFQVIWGFDPINGKPVEGGAFVCTPVDSAKEDVPAFYLKGYAPRKFKQVARVRGERQSYCRRLFDLSYPTAAKRKLRLDDDDVCNVQNINDENRKNYLDNRVHSDSLQQLSSSQMIPDPTDCNSHFCDSNSCGLPLTTSVLPPDLSPAPRNLDTPPNNRSRSVTTVAQVTQSSITDYMPLKKQRVLAKALPRT